MISVSYWGKRCEGGASPGCSLLDRIQVNSILELTFSEIGRLVAIETPQASGMLPLTWTLGGLHCGWPFL
jgi:hypothetical protein